MREIKIDIRAFLIPGTLIRIKFTDLGWVSAVVENNHDKLLDTHDVFDDKPVKLKGPAWFKALHQNNIQICPN